VPEELLDLTGIRVLPPEEEDFVDRTPLRDWTSEEPPLEDIYTLPAQGLEELERDRFGFHVVRADPGSGLDLGEALGEATLLVNGDFFRPEHLIHQLDVLSKGGREPVRVVFRNIGGIKHDAVAELEKLFNRELGYPIKSIYFVDEGGDIDEAVRQKLLMKCDSMVDSATLLDAVAFGFGAKNPYNGVPVGAEAIDLINGPNPKDFFGPI
jgi:hypothetical protein